MSLGHALKWSFLAELAAKVIQPAVFIVLARLLTPEDFGVMSAALMVISFSQIFWEAGMGKALIQRQTNIEDASNAAFWINIGLGTVIASLLFIVAGPVAQTFFHDERVAVVLQIMTVQVFLGAVSAVHTALLQKDMSFKKLFWVRFATAGLPGLASIPLAWNGMGYWALLTGTLIGQAAQVVLLWQLSQWRPKWSFPFSVAKEMGHFGAWVGASGLLGWFYVWADSLIVGMYFGSHELGLYRTGNQFASLIFGMLLGPITPVLYSHLSRMNQDMKRIRTAAKQTMKGLTLIAVPVAIIIFALAAPISDALFGDQWNGISLVIGLLTLMHGFSWVVGMNGEIYRSIGKPSYETIVNATTLLIYLAAYLNSIKYGFEAFILTRLILASGALILHLFVIKKLLSLPVLPILSHILIIAAISGTLVFFVNYYLTSNMSSSWGRLLIGGFASLGAITAALFIFERNGMLKDIRLLIREN